MSKKTKYRTWGKFKSQTVGKTTRGKLYIREKDNKVIINKSEIDSLIVALLEVRE